ncbi:S8 family peptidase [Streptomyces sp. NPDC054796]
MRRTRTRATGLSALCVTALTAAFVVAPGGDASERADAAAPSGEQKEVTLVTGDRVMVDEQGRVASVSPAAGREGTPFSVQQQGEDTYVVPLDTTAMLNSGSLDRRLLNVTQLLKARYDDAHRSALPLIVAYEGAGSSTRSALKSADARIGARLPSIGAEAVKEPRSKSAAVWRALTDAKDGAHVDAAPGVEKIWLDAPVRAVLDESVPQIGAPEAWQAGYDGSGVPVAVLDTGVDETHPDLAGRQVAEKNFSSAPDAVDRFGHGTHVASIVGGSGQKSGGTYKGVAPGAELLDGKVLDDEGFGTESQVVAGMQWAADEGAKVVNLSLGGADTEETDPLEQAVDTLTAEENVLFVIAAGNEGPGAKTVRSPGSAASALTVGAVDKSDVLADFSSRGPTAAGLLKPDLTAPGVDITAAKAAQGTIGDPAQDGYVSLTGTSMATPHVAGTAALLAQQHGDWTAARYKAALTAATEDVADLAPIMQGTGRIDAAQAMRQTLTVEPGTLDFGTQAAPHDDDQPVERPLTYHNAGDQPVTLQLATKEYTFDGSPDSNGTFSVSPRTLTVPAGGTAQATVTADTSRPTDNGTLTTVVTATGDNGQSVRATGKVERQVEMYDLTLTHTGRDGKATADYRTMLAGLTNDYWAWPYESDGSVTLRLPEGSYALDSTLTTKDNAGITGYDWLAQPLLKLTKDTTVALDARKAKPVNVSVPNSKAEQQAVSMGYAAQHNGVSYGQSYWAGTFKGLRTAQLGGAVPDSELSAGAMAVWQAPRKGSTHTHYRMVWRRAGSMFTGLSQKVTSKQLAKVTVGLGSSVPGRTSTLDVEPSMVGELYLGSVAFQQTVPATSVEYLGGTGTRWSHQFTSFAPGGRYEEYYYAAPRTYTPGKSYTEWFNTAVTGPSLSTWYTGVFRNGDNLAAVVPMFADGRDHQGDVWTGSAKTELFRDGTKIWESNSAPGGEGMPVPGEKARYKLTTDVYRTLGAARVSTRITAAWTFTSQRPDGTDDVRLNASVVRFTPAVGLDGTAKKGTSVKVPLTVQGTAAGKGLKKLAVQASFDNGKSWKPVKLTTPKTGSKYVTVKSPGKAGPVSLRAQLTDTTGGALTQTVYRAYLTK